ncbi:unnamed protein product [Coffea canephora]|uniref:BURP domain-containing protein n=1 Tax=Coffea canephora TaxID=49390 RepID=A0A068TNX6_COFCA|nr:unnamed protein product [Coffea canephora]
MAAGLHSCIFFFHALVVLECVCGSRARKIAEEPLNVHDHKETREMLQTTRHNLNAPIYAPDSDNPGRKHVANGVPEKLDQMSPSVSSDKDHMYELAVKVFFTDKQIKLGNRIPIYFPVVEPSARPPLLSREEADSIPFSSSQLPYLLHLFSFSQDSRQAKAMIDTLSHCEFKPATEDAKFCATSLESMLDSAREILGSKAPLKVVTTNHLTEQTSSILQNYTIQDEPRVISPARMVACHVLSYPYAVFYCHTKKDNKLLKVSLVGENGGRVDAAAVCHMDTSDWDPNHLAFRVLKTVPGGSPICHFLPENNLVWVASTPVY